MAEVVRTVVLTDEEATVCLASAELYRLRLDRDDNTAWDRHMVSVIETLDAKVRKARRWRRGK